ncbi:MAG: pectate lyase [Bacteroidota bacterium]
MKNLLLRLLLTVVVCLCFLTLKAQDRQADNMLLFQRASGGWHKQFRGKAFTYDTVFSAADKAQIAAEVKEGAATIDNEATTKEIRYLINSYQSVANPRYLAAAEKGIRYLLKAQYANGGFPQYFPDHGAYRNQITYNDGAMINSLNILRDVTLGRNGFGAVNHSLIDSCANAVIKGIDCILKTQIIANGKLTAWCQQYDQHTLQPAKARAYELPSISGSESVGIVYFLMAQQNPSPQIKAAVKAAVQWLSDVKITGYKVATAPAPGTPKGTDRIIVPDASSVIWARFYEIGTNRPFFCNRDGVKVYTLAQVDYERRNGYAWYGIWPQKLVESDYPAWVSRWK